MRAVIYARYSSDNQTESSIEGQLRECMEFADQTGLEVIGNYIDRAYSAKTDNRPEFQRMIKDSYKRAFDAIIVWKLDRFARNRYDSAHYKTLLKKNGVKVISAKETITSGSEGILLESVLEGMAEYYSAELSEKVVRGMTENALKGKNNGGQVTFGYMIDDAMYFHPHPTTAPIVKEIFTLYADGKTIKQIVDYLNEKKITTIRGGKMTINIVQRMLSNRRYIGEYKFRDTVIPGAIPALVPIQLFERVQQRLVINKRAPARHKAEDEYLLTLKLFCGKCGAHMFGESGTGTSRTYRYYKCARAKRGKLCDKKTVRKEWIEDLAIQKALTVLENKELIEHLVEKIYLLQRDENPRLPRLNEQLADIEKRIENIISAIEQGIIAESTKTRLIQLEENKKELQNCILQEKLKKPFLSKEQVRFGIEKYKKLDLSTQEGKQRLIDGFINAIYLYDDRIIFTYNFKDGSETVTLAEFEASKGSDIKCVGAPQKRHRYLPVPFLLCAHGSSNWLPHKGQAIRARSALRPQGAKLLRARHKKATDFCLRLFCYVLIAARIGCPIRGKLFGHAVPCARRTQNSLGRVLAFLYTTDCCPRLFCYAPIAARIGCPAGASYSGTQCLAPAGRKTP